MGDNALSSFLQEYLRDDLIYQNIPLSAKVLAKKEDREVAGLFYFLYDGPHPDNYKKGYEHLYKELRQVNPRVASLLKLAYEKLLSEEHCPGH